MLPGIAWRGRVTEWYLQEVSGEGYGVGQLDGWLPEDRSHRGCAGFDVSRLVLLTGRYRGFVQPVRRIPASLVWRWLVDEHGTPCRVTDLIEQWWHSLDMDIRLLFGAASQPDLTLLTAILREVGLPAEATPADFLATMLRPDGQDRLQVILTQAKADLIEGKAEIGRYGPETENAATRILRAVADAGVRLDRKQERAILDAAVEVVPEAVLRRVRDRLAGDPPASWWTTEHRYVLTPALRRAAGVVWPKAVAEARKAAVGTFMAGAALADLSRGRADSDKVELHHEIAGLLVNLGLKSSDEPLPDPEPNGRLWSAAAARAVVVVVYHFAGRFGTVCGLDTPEARLAYALALLLRLCGGHPRGQLEPGCLRTKIRTLFSDSGGDIPGEWTSTQARILFGEFIGHVEIGSLLSPPAVAWLVGSSAGGEGVLADEVDGLPSLVASRMVASSCAWRGSLFRISRDYGSDDERVDWEQHRRICSTLVRWELDGDEGDLVSALTRVRKILASPRYAVQDVAKSYPQGGSGYDLNDSDWATARDYRTRDTAAEEVRRRMADFLELAARVGWPALAEHPPCCLPASKHALWKAGARVLPAFLQWVETQYDLPATEALLAQDVWFGGAAATGRSSSYTRLQDACAEFHGEVLLPAPRREEFCDAAAYRAERDRRSQQRRRARLAHSPDEQILTIFRRHLNSCTQDSAESNPHALPCCAAEVTKGVDDDKQL